MIGIVGLPKSHQNAIPSENDACENVCEEINLVANIRIYPSRQTDEICIHWWQSVARSVRSEAGRSGMPRAQHSAPLNDPRPTHSRDGSALPLPA